LPRVASIANPWAIGGALPAGSTPPKNLLWVRPNGGSAGAAGFDKPNRLRRSPDRTPPLRIRKAHEPGARDRACNPRRRHRAKPQSSFTV